MTQLPTLPLNAIYADFCTRLTPNATTNGVNFVWGNPAWMLRMFGTGKIDAFGEPLTEHVAQTVIWPHSQKRDIHAARWLPI